MQIYEVVSINGILVFNLYMLWAYTLLPIYWHHGPREIGHGHLRTKHRLRFLILCRSDLSIYRLRSVCVGKGVVCLTSSLGSFCAHGCIESVHPSVLLSYIRLVDMIQWD